MNDGELISAGFFFIPQTAADSAPVGALPDIAGEAGREEFLRMLKNALSELGEEKSPETSKGGAQETAIPPQNVGAFLEIEGEETLADLLISEEKNSLKALPIIGLKPLGFAESGEEINLSAAIAAESEKPLSEVESAEEPSIAPLLSMEDKFILPAASLPPAETPPPALCAEEFISHYKEVLAKADEILGWLKVSDKTASNEVKGEVKENNLIGRQDLLEVITLEEGGAEASAVEPALKSGIVNIAPNGEPSEFAAAEKSEPVRDGVNTAPIDQVNTPRINIAQAGEKWVAAAKFVKSEAPAVPVKNDPLPETKSAFIEEVIKSKPLEGAQVVETAAAKTKEETPVTIYNEANRKAVEGKNSEKAPLKAETPLPEKGGAAAKTETAKNEITGKSESLNSTAQNGISESAEEQAEIIKQETAARPSEKAENVSDKPLSKTSEKDETLKTDELKDKGEQKRELKGDLKGDPVTEKTELTAKTDGKLTPKPAAVEKTLEWQSPKDAVKFAKLVQQAGEGGASKLTVRLIPEHLGKIEIQLTEINGRLDAKILANSMESKNFLAANADAITKQLAEKGITIDNMDFAFHDSLAKDAREKSGRERESRTNKIKVRLEEGIKETPAEQEDIGLYA
jgi:hypothetical protein